MRGVVLVLLLGLALPAQADESAEGLAKQYFVRARAEHAEGRYAQAIADYQAAYALAPLPELLFNLGQCHRLSGRHAEAVLYYQRYLEVVPYGGVSEDARGHISTLRGQPAVTQPALVATTRKPFPWRWVSVGIVGSGLVLVAVGAGFGVEAAGASDRLKDARGPQREAIEDERRADLKRMWVLGGLGTAAVATGLTLFLWKGQEQPRLAARPLLAPGGAGLALAGTF